MERKETEGKKEEPNRHYLKISTNFAKKWNDFYESVYGTSFGGEEKKALWQFNRICSTVGPIFLETGTKFLLSNLQKAIENHWLQENDVKYVPSKKHKGVVRLTHIDPDAIKSGWEKAKKSPGYTKSTETYLALPNDLKKKAGKNVNKSPDQLAISLNLLQQLCEKTNPASLPTDPGIIHLGSLKKAIEIGWLQETDVLYVPLPKKEGYGQITHINPAGIRRGTSVYNDLLYTLKFGLFALKLNQPEYDPSLNLKGTLAYPVSVVAHVSFIKTPHDSPVDESAEKIRLNLFKKAFEQKAVQALEISEQGHISFKITYPTLKKIYDIRQMLLNENKEVKKPEVFLAVDQSAHLEKLVTLLDDPHVQALLPLMPEMNKYVQEFRKNEAAVDKNSVTPELDEVVTGLFKDRTNAVFNDALVALIQNPESSKLTKTLLDTINTSPADRYAINKAYIRALHAAPVKVDAQEAAALYDRLDDMLFENQVRIEAANISNYAFVNLKKGTKFETTAEEISPHLSYTSITEKKGFVEALEEKRAGKSAYGALDQFFPQQAARGELKKQKALISEENPSSKSSLEAAVARVKTHTDQLMKAAKNAPAQTL